MFISFDDFISRFGFPSWRMISEEKIGEQNKNGIILLEAGGIETEDDWTLTSSFIDKKENTYWGFYKIYDYRNDLNLKTCDVIWCEQKQRAIYNDMTWRGFTFDHGLVKNSDEFHKKYCKNGYRLTHEELMKIKSDIVIDVWFNEVIDNTLRLEYNHPNFKVFPSVEYPYVFEIFGNDDTSYTKVFDTKNNLYEFISKWESNKFTYNDCSEMIFTN